MIDFPDRITFADDDKVLRDIVRTAVENKREGVLFLTCDSGEQLVSSIDDMQPQLILLDLKMAEMSGPDTIEKLRANDTAKHIPIIFLTGVTDVEMSEDYKKMNVIGVIHKPVDPENLADTIEELWKQHEEE